MWPYRVVVAQPGLGGFADLYSSVEGTGARQGRDRINALTDYLAKIQLSEE